MTLDEDLLESLFYRYSQRMENFAAHILGDAAAAEDVVQDSFVKLYSKYRGKDEKNFVPLLFTVLRNSCKDTLRRRLSKGNVITTDFFCVFMRKINFVSNKIRDHLPHRAVRL